MPTDPVIDLRLTSAEKHIEKLESEMEVLQKTMVDRDRSKLMKEVATLTTAVFALVSIIWAYRSEIFK